MIVNYTVGGWEIITQRAHGLLAASLASNWSKNVQSHRWIETLIAIAEHDDAQLEMEQANLLTPQGGPVDFAMRGMELSHCRETMTRACSKSIYIALLCSYHLNFLCNDNNNDADLKAFLNEQKALRKKWLEQLGMTNSDLQHDYRLFEWCDALSLLLCTQKCQPEGRSLDVSKGPDGNLHKLKAIDSEYLTIEPWPFEQDQFTVQCEARTIEQLAFKNDEEFKRRFNGCIPELRTWKFKKN
ncbi:DUF3891 family protein [uncultured Mucilaginibacter sp.]|uniref:DUF3891 family protein n=1 Tax=uncultured Mucilaginibacter sp. TaxID=797541 RepID=UPI0025F7D778|nr:DUF3891 family protein [uncultured Mucilaginibacter sp.]